MKIGFYIIALAIVFSSFNSKAQKQAAEVYLKSGVARAGLEDYIGAIADFNKAIECYPRDVNAYSYRGAAKVELQDYRGAIADYNKVIKLKPKDLKAYYNRGLAKIKLKDINGGCLDLSKAGELGENGAYEAIQKHCNQSPLP